MHLSLLVGHHDRRGLDRRSSPSSFVAGYRFVGACRRVVLGGLWETPCPVSSESSPVFRCRRGGSGQPPRVCGWIWTAGSGRAGCHASSVFDLPQARQAGAQRKPGPKRNPTQVPIVPTKPTSGRRARAQETAGNAAGVGNREFRDSVARPSRRSSAVVRDPGRAFPSLPDSPVALLVREWASDRALHAANTAP